MPQVHHRHRPSAAAEERAAPTTVVVVEDEPALRELFVLALGRHDGLAVVGRAADGPAAVAAVARCQPDLVLLDLRVPGLRGPELMQALREVAPDARIVATSGHGGAEVEDAALRAGASAFVRKGVEVAVLVETLLRVRDLPPPAPVAPPDRVRAPRPPAPGTPAAGSTPARPPRRILLGWLLAGLVALAGTGAVAAFHAQAHRSAVVEARTTTQALAGQVASVVTTRATTLRELADALLAGEVDDALLADVLERTVPFAIVLDADAPRVLAATPPRELDAVDLLARFEHIRDAAVGRVGVGGALTGGTEAEARRIATAIAIPFAGDDGGARVLSTAFWIEESEVDRALVGYAVSRPGTTVRLRSGDDVLLTEHSAADAQAGGGEVRVVAPVGSTGWEVEVVGTAAAFEGRLARGAAVSWLTALGVLLACAAGAAAWHRSVRAAERLDTAHRDLQRVHDQQQEFLAVASHELRTPLSVVVGFATTLEDQWEVLPEGVRRDITARVSRSAVRLSGLLDDLLTTTLTRKGEVHLVPQPVEVRSLVELARAGSRLASVPVTVRLGEPGTAVRVDPTYGPRMLANLLDNAEKYGEAPYVVTVAPADDVVEIVVRDHGAGVPPELEGDLFEAFRQGAEQLSRRAGGVGLGLHVVARLAAESGGAVRYRRPRGGGAEFVLSLPAARAGAAEVVR